jgi:hypothetical protein
MMTHSEFQQQIAFLGISTEEAAQLLGFSDRTLRRWGEDNQIPAVAEAAIRAWRKLHERRIPWKPDTLSIFDDDQDQISKMRDHAVEVAEMIERVEARGGPAAPWQVALDKGAATLGGATVTFYTLANGAFSPSHYSRRDMPPDTRRDQHLIEDAAYCIYQAFKGSTARAEALKAVAEYVRKHAHLYVRTGARVHNQGQRSAHELLILTVAGELEDLAALAVSNRVTYRDFQLKLERLHQLGFSPELSLVSEVARVFR